MVTGITTCEDSPKFLAPNWKAGKINLYLYHMMDSGRDCGYVLKGKCVSCRTFVPETVLLQAKLLGIETL